jgi:hypothetical protein
MIRSNDANREEGMHQSAVISLVLALHVGCASLVVAPRERAVGGSPEAVALATIQVFRDLLEVRAERTGTGGAVERSLVRIHGEAWGEPATGGERFRCNLAPELVDRLLDRIQTEAGRYGI